LDIEHSHYFNILHSLALVRHSQTSLFPFDVFAFGRAFITFQITKEVVYKTSEFPFKDFVDVMTDV